MGLRAGSARQSQLAKVCFKSGMDWETDGRGTCCVKTMYDNCVKLNETFSEPEGA